MSCLTSLADPCAYSGQPTAVIDTVQYLTLVDAYRIPYPDLPLPLPRQGELAHMHGTQLSKLDHTLSCETNVIFTRQRVGSALSHSDASGRVSNSKNSMVRQIHSRPDDRGRVPIAFTLEFELVLHVM